MFQRLISFATAAALILATLPVIIPAPAQARFPHGSAASCPQATDNGCAAAPANGSFKNASLLTSAQQSGQTSLLPTRAGGSLTLNIPAVDYGIGPDSTLTPQDPRNISDGVCAYNPTGAAGGKPWVYCAGTGVINETLNNYDFCGSKIGKALVQLYVGGTGSPSPTLGSTFTVTNSYFCIPPDDGAMGWGGGVGPNWNIVYKNNKCDGGTANTNSRFCLNDDADAVGTSVDIEYNAFTNQNMGRVAGGPTNISWKFDYNFVQGLNDFATADHGEVMIRNCTGGRMNCNPPLEEYRGNFIIWNRITVGAVNHTTFFVSDGSSDGIILGALNILNNVIVTNTDASGFEQVGKALFDIRVANAGVVTITGNWVDATGSTICGRNGTVGNGDGTASTSGNTINITNLNANFNNFPIEPGNFLINPGFTTAAITAYGTGAGATGTYTFGGAAQTQGSTSTWTIVPAYSGTPTLAPNWNLVSPGGAIGFNGPTMAEASCLGTH